MEVVRERRGETGRTQCERKAAGRATEESGNLGCHAPILRGFLRQSRTAAEREPSGSCRKSEKNRSQSDGNRTVARVRGNWGIRVSRSARRDFSDRFLGFRFRGLISLGDGFFARGCGRGRRDGLYGFLRGSRRFRSALRFGCRGGPRFRRIIRNYGNFHGSFRRSFGRFDHEREPVRCRNRLSERRSGSSESLPAIGKKPIRTGFQRNAFRLERHRATRRIADVPVFSGRHEVDS